jgi:hypothetical protein
MSEQTMRAAIETQLNTACTAQGVPFLIEDTKAHKPDSGPYVTMEILGGDSRRANLGGKRTTRHVGILQIDCMYPKDSGMGKVTNLATNVGKYFDEWTKALPDEATVHFRVPKQTNLGVQGEHQRVAVSIAYWRDERGK